jgi:hypothetical protein
LFDFSNSRGRAEEASAAEEIIPEDAEKEVAGLAQDVEDVEDIEEAEGPSAEPEAVPAEEMTPEAQVKETAHGAEEAQEA